MEGGGRGDIDVRLVSKLAGRVNFGGRENRDTFEDYTGLEIQSCTVKQIDGGKCYCGMFRGRPNPPAPASGWYALCNKL